MEDNKTLFGKLARITQKMQRIRKTGRHPQGYQFATDTDIIESVRDAMADENIAIISNLVSWQVLEGGATQKGAPIFHTVAEFEFVFVCADTGASFACKWVNEALDSSDKGFNKAATAALKYFLMKTFLITTGEPDLHEGDNVQATKKSVGNTTQKAPPPEATKPNPFSGQQPSTSNVLPDKVYRVNRFQVNLSKGRVPQPYLIFAIGETEYAYSYTRQPFADAGYDVTDWKNVGNHEMPCPAEITVEKHVSKDGKVADQWTVKSVKMIDLFAEAS